VGGTDDNLPFNGYFIDIGVVEDYERAKIDFKKLAYE